MPSAFLYGNSGAVIRFRRRTSAGSRPVRAAIRSITRSIANVVVTMATPRYAPRGTLLVTTLVASYS